jgi:hypothetical protein
MTHFIKDLPGLDNGRGFEKLGHWKSAASFFDWLPMTVVG